MKTQEFANIDFNSENGVGYITINNPPVNTLSTKTLNGLAECFKQAIADQDIRVIVITGQGKMFVAGADIAEFTEAFNDAQKGKKLSQDAQAVMNTIESSTKPVIAAINGACLGGGLELAMSCHLRIAANEAKLGQPELNLGLIPGFGGTQRLTRLINKAKAIELILIGNFIGGQEAEKIGLVNKSVPLTELMEETKKFAESIALNKSTESVKATLIAINQGIETTLDKGLEIEAEQWAQLFETKNMIEGVNAFMEKRKPSFK
uniref:Predicted CoA hydratase n=1 Tax=Psychrobacter sp. J466 TaxID=674035 RepID=D0U566_9GAMM|nr:predicted CoA hydratase [Psychrobacter sp. J466]